MGSTADSALSLQPIGFVRCALKTRVEAGRQPGVAATADGRIELLPGRHFEHALLDLDAWEFIWVIFCFHLNTGWRPKVLPPRSRSGRKGVFATRSPHRPNPLGLSVVRLERIDGLTLQVSDIDMLDGTPVLDIKPYVAYSDARPDARTGWLENAADPIPAHEVPFEALAARQAEWIEARTGLDIRRRIEETLVLGPEPHPYRRIKRDADRLQLAVKEWRVQCLLAGREIRVLAIVSGYRAAQLVAADPAAEPFATHRIFNQEFAAAVAPQA